MRDPGDEHHDHQAVTDHGDRCINADHLLEWLRSGPVGEYGAQWVERYLEELSNVSTSRVVDKSGRGTSRVFVTDPDWDDRVRSALEMWDEADNQSLDVVRYIRERAINGNALSDLLRSTLPEEK